MGIWIKGKPDKSIAKSEADKERRQPRRSFQSFAKRPLREVTTGDIENVVQAIGGLTLGQPINSAPSSQQFGITRCAAGTPPQIPCVL